MKQIKIEEDVHERLARYCTRDKTFGECIDDLLGNEPFVSRLLEVLPPTITRVEGAKKSGRIDHSMADDLIRVAQWIVETSRARALGMTKEEFQKFREIVKELRKLTDLFKSEGVSDEEFSKRQLELLNALHELQGLPKVQWAKDEKGEWVLTEVSK